MTTQAADSERVLLLAPRGRDAEVACALLAEAEVRTIPCASMDGLCAEIEAGAGAVLVTTEALGKHALARFAQALRAQPSWSELPVIVCAGVGMERFVRSLEPILRPAHVTILDRPLRVKTLIDAARSALSTRRRQYALRDALAELEGRVHERDKFLAILGHELRNPLAAILLASQMREAERGLEPRHAAVIERQARHLTRLVDDLLELSRVTAGKIVLQRQAVDLTQVIAQSLATLGDAAATHRVEMVVSSAPTPVLVDGDPVRLEQIVGNLLTNAIKYTPAGGRVVLTVKAEEGCAVFRVEDTGVGIAQERLDRIFGLFTQAENAVGRTQGGMGIGLSLVRSLVEMHGGSVTAASEGVNMGSAFTVRLPLVRASTPPPPRATSDPSIAMDDETFRILVVEDNPDVRSLLEMKLARLGHEVDGVGDGEDGVERILETSPDLALVDLGLPGIDGYEVGARVRAAMGDSIFLVALSGFGQPEDKRRALEVGFDEHITKPADAQALSALLARVRLRRAARSGDRAEGHA